MNATEHASTESTKYKYHSVKRDNENRHAAWGKAKKFWNNHHVQTAVSVGIIGAKVMGFAFVACFAVKTGVNVGLNSADKIAPRN